MRRTGKAVDIRVGMTMDEIKKRVLVDTLRECDWNKRAAAAVLRISLKTTYNYINKYRLPLTEPAGRELSE